MGFYPVWHMASPATQAVIRTLALGRGRAGQGEYFAALAVIGCANIAYGLAVSLAPIADERPVWAAIVLAVAALLLVWATLALLVRRGHDFDILGGVAVLAYFGLFFGVSVLPLKGWLGLVLGYAPLVLFGLVPGNPRHNRFGCPTRKAGQPAVMGRVQRSSRPSPARSDRAAPDA